MPSLARPATPADVATLYRVILGREPESAAVIADKTGMATGALVRAFLESEEYRRSTVNLLAERFHADPPSGAIETSCSRAEFARLLENARATWEKLGREDPYWSVMTNEAYRGEEIREALEDGFFQSGQVDVDVFRAICLRNGLALPRDGVVLDFGCGVGRLGVHLAPLGREYLGVDISAPHLRLAERHLRTAGIGNAGFQSLPDFLADDRPIDIYFSIIVLQHNPPPIICHLVAKALERLSRGGVAYFQIPRGLFGYSYSAADHIANFRETGFMEMHAVPQREVFRLIRAAGCDLVECLPDGKTGACGLSTTYLVTRS